MNYELSPSAGAPSALSKEPTELRRAGRFSQTRRTRAMRRVFAILCKYAPALATHLAFGLLVRPPRTEVRDWHLLLRKKALRPFY